MGVRVARWTVTAGILLSWAAGADGQDTRTVTEPTFPPSCTVMDAQLAIINEEPASETAFDTTRIQTALDNCPAGQSVELQSSGTNDAFLIQPLNIPSGVTLLVDGGVTVFASRNPADYQLGTVSSTVDECGTVGPHGNGCKSLFSVNNGSTSSGSGIMGFGVIEGRGYGKLLLNGAESTQNWWDVARAATTGTSQNNFIMLQTGKGNNFTLYKITLRNSAKFHVAWKGDGFTAWGVKIITPYTARNSDGIDPGGSNITITNSSISDGDDNVAVSASSASANVTVSNVNTYSGHGISVGSFTHGGLTNMLVDHVNMAGTATDNNAVGIRLKTAADRGGLLQNITYQNMCLKDMRSMVQLNPFYNSNPGTLLPQFTNVAIRNAHFLTPGRLQLQGYDADHTTTLTLDNVVFDTLNPTDITPAPQFTTITLGPGEVYPDLLQMLAGDGVAYGGSAPVDNANALDCTNAFPYVVGELYLSTASQNNLRTLSTTSGESFTLSAMVQPAMSQVSYAAWTGTPPLTNPIVFLEGSTVVGTASLGANGTLASLALTDVTPGTHMYTAQYPADANYPALNFGSVTVNVSGGLPSKTTTSVTLSSPSIFVGDTAILTATVSSDAGTPSGTVTFWDGTTPLGSGTLADGAATLSVTPAVEGTLSITATYEANGHFDASVSAPQVLTVETASSLSVTQLLPAPGNGDICIDTPLSVTFDGEPHLGSAGRIRIYRSDGTLADSINLGDPNSFKRSIGGAQAGGVLYPFNYHPVIITGDTAVIYPHQMLEYGQTYYVLIDPGVFRDAEGNSVRGIQDSDLFVVSTRFDGPPDGATTLTVAADGTGDFCTVQGAIDFVPVNNTQRVIINVLDGTYEEIVYVRSSKPFITVAGQSRDGTVIQYDNNSNFNGAVSGNFRAMFGVDASDFVLANITLYNTTPKGGSQAEALRGNGQRTVLNGVHLKSFQDTLLLQGLGFVTDSLIEGDVDYMWGSGTVFFQNCELTALSPGYYTQIRNTQTRFGDVYVNCVLDRAPGLADNTLYLGRIDPNVFPYSQVVFINSAMDTHIRRVGWLLNNGTCEQAPNIQFWEYHSTDLSGNLLDVSDRLPCSRQLTDEEAAQWSDPSFVLGGWVPDTTLPVVSRR
jgi:hypothetical protein